VKVVIDLARVYYDDILSQIPNHHPIIATLKSAVALRRWEDGAEVEHMVFLCGVDAAKIIAGIAKQLTPEISGAIERSIYLAQFFW
jgi:hypothetical protein